MKRGEVWWVDFASSSGGEVQKRRPAIIVSNNAANQYANRIQVVPVTSNISKLYPCDAEVTVANKAAKAMADQLTTVSKMRLGKKLGELSEADIQQVQTAMRVQLALL